MNKKTRTAIFLICLLLFALIAPLAVSYSLGYRFDFEAKKLSQTGGLFLKVIPKQADIFINGKANKKTDFFFGSALIENLLPKNHKVEVKKEGYHSWQKTLPIKEKEVTEAKNIILFPKEIEFNRLTDQVKEFWFSPDQKKLILGESQGPSWALKIYDLKRNIKSHLISKDDFFSQDLELIDLDFSEDSKKIHLKVKTKEQIKHFALEIDATKPALSQTEPPVLPKTEALVYKEINSNVYYLDTLGHFFKSKEKLNSRPFLIKQGSRYDLKIFQNFIFLQEDNVLYKFEPATKTFEYFFENINSLKISPDKTKLAYFSDYEIWLLFLSDKNNPLQKKSGEKLLLMRLSEKITDLFWLNPDYLIFQTNEKIKISEIDERDKPNIIDLFEIKNLIQEGNSPKMFFSQFDKKIYILSKEILHNSNPLLP